MCITYILIKCFTSTYNALGQLKSTSVKKQFFADPASVFRAP